MKLNESLDQYFIPTWAAELIISRYYANLRSDHTIYDVGCGDGRFLQAVPPHVKAYGIEIDPRLADLAHSNTGRPILQVDMREIAFPERPTHCIGNPPYDMKLVNGFLDRAYDAMDYGGQAGFLLPVYFFQTADTVVDYFKKWSIRYDLVPRNLFESMSKPLMFAQFYKEKLTASVGFFLYDETSDIHRLSKEYRYLFIGNQSATNLWGEVIERALVKLGGEATLQAIYNEIDGKRPTKTEHWKEQIRKRLQQSFRKIGPSLYGLMLPNAQSSGKTAPNIQIGFSF